MEQGERRWYVMRDLKRANAKNPAYKQLAERGMEVFTPLQWRLQTVKGKRQRVQVPFLTDLVFIHDERSRIDPIVELTPTLQYRYVRGGYCTPMTVAEKDMERFIQAISLTDNPQYYTPQEISAKMLGSTVRIIDGPFNGYEGKLLTIRGSRKRRLVVEIPNLIAVAVEVEPEFIEVILTGDS